jgi:hypothetical protein
MAVFSAFRAILAQRRKSGDGAAAAPQNAGQARREGLDSFCPPQQTLPVNKGGRRMLKYLSIIAIGVALALPASPTAAQQKPKAKAKSGPCVSPRDVCFKRCLEQAGRNCAVFCNSRPNTC